jgi:hypothetical protein
MTYDVFILGLAFLGGDDDQGSRLLNSVKKEQHQRTQVLRVDASLHTCDDHLCANHIFSTSSKARIFWSPTQEKNNTEVWL